MKIKFLTVLAAFAALLCVTGCQDAGAAENSTDSSSVSSTESSSVSGLESGTESSSESSENTEEQSEVTVMYVTINSNKLEVELADNSSVDALVEILKKTDITYTADDYGGFEKVGGIGYTLPTNDEEITIEAGDVILYTGSNICLYYGTNTWSFTRIGKITGYTQAELKTLLCAGQGSVQVTLSLN